MIALDFVIAEQDDALVIGDQLPLEMGTDVPRAPTEDVYPSIVGVVLIADDDVGREASLLLRPPQGFLDDLCAPLRGEVAGNDVAIGAEGRWEYSSARSRVYDH